MEIIGRYVVTEDEERLDRIARAIYGDEGNGAVERLLDANPGLSGRTPTATGALPFGTVVTVPAVPAAADTGPTRPWQ